MIPELCTLGGRVIEDADYKPDAREMEYLAQINTADDLGNFQDSGNGAMIALAVEAALALGLDKKEVDRLEDQWNLRHITRKINARKSTDIDIQPDGTAVAVRKAQMLIYRVTFKHIRTEAAHRTDIPGFSFLDVMTYANKCAGHGYTIELIERITDQEEPPCRIESSS